MYYLAIEKCIMYVIRGTKKVLKNMIFFCWNLFVFSINNMFRNSNPSEPFFSDLFRINVKHKTTSQYSIRLFASVAEPAPDPGAGFGGPGYGA